MSIEKQWWKSTTIQGQIVVAIGLILSVLKALYGIDLLGQDELSTAVTAGLTLFGIAMGVYGRIKATKLISLN